MARGFAAGSSQYYYGSTPVSAFPFTMACRFVSNNITADYGIMDLTDSGTAYDRECIMTRGGSAGDPIDYLFGQSNHCRTTNGFTASAWQSAAVIASASDSRRVVLNGDWANSGTSATNYDDWATIDRVDIGRLGDSTPSSYLDGLVAEAAVWCAALVQAEIEMLNAGVSPLLIRPASLAAYWPLIGRYATEIDLVGGYALTPSASAPTAAAHPRVLRPASPYISFAHYSAPTPPAGRRRSWATVIGG